MQYPFEFHGDCMGAFIPSGSVLLAHPADEVKPLDMVTAVFDLDSAGAFVAFANAAKAQEGAVGMCKIYLGTFEKSDGESVHLLAQLNPPAITPVPASTLSSMHKVTGSADGTSCIALGDLEMQALELLMPFILMGRPKMKGD